MFANIIQSYSLIMKEFSTRQFGRNYSHSQSQQMSLYQTYLNDETFEKVPKDLEAIKNRICERKFKNCIMENLLVVANFSSFQIFSSTHFLIILGNLRSSILTKRPSHLNCPSSIRSSNTFTLHLTSFDRSSLFPHLSSNIYLPCLLYYIHYFFKYFPSFLWQKL